MKKLTIPGLTMLAILFAIPAFVTLSAVPATAQAPATASVVLHVDGMHCANCPITVRTVLRLIWCCSHHSRSAGKRSPTCQRPLCS